MFLQAQCKIINLWPKHTGTKLVANWQRTRILASHWHNAAAVQCELHTESPLQTARHKLSLTSLARLHRLNERRNSQCCSVKGFVTSLVWPQSLETLTHKYHKCMLYCNGMHRSCSTKCIRTIRNRDHARVIGCKATWKPPDKTCSWSPVSFLIPCETLHCRRICSNFSNYLYFPYWINIIQVK